MKPPKNPQAMILACAWPGYRLIAPPKMQRPQRHTNDSGQHAFREENAERFFAEVSESNPFCFFGNHSVPVVLRRNGGHCISINGFAHHSLHFVWRPDVAAPHLNQFALRTDERGAQVVID